MDTQTTDSNSQFPSNQSKYENQGEIFFNYAKKKNGILKEADIFNKGQVEFKVQYWLDYNVIRIGKEIKCIFILRRLSVKKKKPLDEFFCPFIISSQLFFHQVS